MCCHVYLFDTLWTRCWLSSEDEQHEAKPGRQRHKHKCLHACEEKTRKIHKVKSKIYVEASTFSVVAKLTIEIDVNYWQGMDLCKCRTFRYIYSSYLYFLGLTSDVYCLIVAFNKAHSLGFLPTEVFYWFDLFSHNSASNSCGSRLVSIWRCHVQRFKQIVWDYVLDQEFQCNIMTLLGHLWSIAWCSMLENNHKRAIEE